MSKCELKESERAELLMRPRDGVAVAHFEACPSCARASAQQSGLWRALDAWTVPEVSAGFNRALYAKIDAASAAPWYERWAAALRPSFSRPAVAIAVAGLAIVGGFMLDHPSGKRYPHPPVHLTAVQSPAVQVSTAQVSTTEVEQVEKTLEDLEMLRQFDLPGEEKDNASKSM